MRRRQNVLRSDTDSVHVRMREVGVSMHMQDLKKYHDTH